MSSKPTAKDEKSFENAFQRLEVILEKMNDGKVSLDESIKLYEEADGLIEICSKKLLNAEKKIEKLAKQREGTIATDQQGNPLMEEF